MGINWICYLKCVLGVLHYNKFVVFMHNPVRVLKRTMCNLIFSFFPSNIAFQSNHLVGVHYPY